MEASAAGQLMEFGRQGDHLVSDFRIVGGPRLFETPRRLTKEFLGAILTAIGHAINCTSLGIGSGGKIGTRTRLGEADGAQAGARHRATMRNVLPLELPGTRRPVAIITLRSRTLSPLAQLFAARMRATIKSKTDARRPQARAG